MARRRSIDERTAVELVREAEQSGSAVEGIEFPVMRIGSLRGVRFIDCDIGRVTFGGGPLRRASVIECFFERCSGPHHSLFRKASFDRCRWERSGVSGAFTDVVISASAFVACDLTDLTFNGCDLLDTAFDQVELDSVRVDGCTLKRVSCTGRAVHLNLSGSWLEHTDLSGLHVIDGAFDGLTTEDVRYPDFDDSFVVVADDLERIRPGLLEVVRPGARSTLEHALGRPFEFEIDVFDRPRFDALYGDGPRLWVEEQQTVLRALHDVRLVASPSAAKSGTR